MTFPRFIRVSQYGRLNAVGVLQTTLVVHEDIKDSEGDTERKYVARTRLVMDDAPRDGTRIILFKGIRASSGYWNGTRWVGSNFQDADGWMDYPIP